VFIRQGTITARMGRWSYYDTDYERLPAGMERIGYDADTGIYTYRDSDGSLWEGASGARYGSLTKVSNGYRSGAGQTSSKSANVSQYISSVL